MMSQSLPQLARSRTAILAVTGVAVVYGIYVVYNTLPQSKKNSLHRSNAIHGQRPARFRQNEPSESHPAHNGHPDVDGETSTIAETQEPDAADEPIDQPSQGIKGLLYHIAEGNAKMKGYEHRGIHCEECGDRPILGVRWHCLNCPDFDLCSPCEATTAHQKSHVFVKIKIPLPVLSQPSKAHLPWYTGDPRNLLEPLDPDVKKRLGDLYKFDPEHMDAHYDQFVCLANVSWHDKRNKVMAAIDKTGFNKSLTSDMWPQRFRPNALYDRMFAFYDTDGDGYIGFEEFVGGLAYLRGPDRFTPLRRALQGFDIDANGYVDRFDFMRIFRAKWEIEKLLLEMQLQVRDAEQARAAMDTLQASVPISSIFAEGDIPQGEERPRGGKTADTFGDLLPDESTETILRDSEGWSDEHVPLRSSIGYPSSTDFDGTGPEAIEYQQTAPRFEDTEDLPFNENIMRQIAEEGFREMLDPLFRKKEVRDRQVVESREERAKWRKDIDAAVQEKVRSQVHPSAAKELTDGLVPTDFASLKQRELEIVQAPLDDLLDATGYSVNDTTAQAPLGGDLLEAMDYGSNAATTHRDSFDPTMPQNRPNSDAVTQAKPPPKPYLLHLGLLDSLDREIEARGGTGRLNFDEIEELVKADRSKELRGIVTTWLEWASF